MDENTNPIPSEEQADRPARPGRQIANMDYSDYVLLLMESRIIEPAQ